MQTNFSNIAFDVFRNGQSGQTFNAYQRWESAAKRAEIVNARDRSFGPIKQGLTADLSKHPKTTRRDRRAAFRALPRKVREAINRERGKRLGYGG